MAQRKRKRKKQTRQPKPEPYPGWMWMVFGLAIGLSVAFAIYMKDRDRWASPQPVAAEPASMAAPMASPPPPTPEPEPEQAPEEESEPRFSFYSMLPNFEVVIPEEESDVTRDQAVEPVQAPGTYVLQAGSFAEASDADRRRAELALLGIESRIQRISIDDRTYHRVRIGPMNDLDELNLVREQLRQADIDALRIRLGD